MISRHRNVLLTALALAIGLAGAAIAQRIVPKAAPPIGGPSATFDYYTLALSWSPTHCAEAGRGDSDPQCSPRDGRRFAFVLHGLWPQFERGFPEFCPTRERPFVPQAVIDRMQDIMPSPRLTIHQYRKHGTCSGLDPEDYFDLSRKIYGKVRVPSQFINPTAAFFVTPGEVAKGFLDANPSLKPDMLVVVCGGQGNRLREVRVCFDKQGEPRTCGKNEDQRRLCSAGRMFVPPVRTGRGPGERQI
jgi:ribonuclease T2